MRYFYDCEFIEDGRFIDLISIGVVAEDGREFYAVSAEFDPQLAGKWVRNHVLPKLPTVSSPVWKSRASIREQLFAFLLDGAGEIELWAWVGAYDHVALCQLWGSMTSLPREIPRFTHELRQYWKQNGSPPLPELSSGGHDALVDAQHNFARWQAIEQFRFSP